jgi:hypothetical protein
MDHRYLVAPVWAVAVVIGLSGMSLVPISAHGWNAVALLVHVAVTLLAIAGLGASVIRPSSVAGHPGFAIGAIAILAVGGFLRLGETLFGFVYSIVALFAIATGVYAAVAERRRRDRGRPA